MFDGKRSTNDVLKTTAGLGITEEDVKHLVGLGWLSAKAGTVPTVAVPLQSGPKAPCLSAHAHYSKAYPIATRLTAGLGLRGFRLNLAVEAAGDLVKLRKLAPKIMRAVGPEKFEELNIALYE